jgi:4'-phosphopantetheinyl transferase
VGAILATPVLTALGPERVRVWLAPLDLDPPLLSRLSSALSPDELGRASRYRFGRYRDRFVAARGLLRHALAAHLQTGPESIRLGYSANGKPFLEGGSDFCFNLSHAGPHLMIAMARGRRLGVDLEPDPAERVITGVAEVVLSPPERSALARTARPERSTWFGRMWTRKEAFMKADGRGMEMPLDRIDVMTDPGSVRLRDPGPGWHRSADWSLRTTPAPPGHAACVAAEGSAWSVEHAEWRLSSEDA